MNSTTPTIPEGYWQDASGNLVPDAKVKDIDKLRDQLVKELCLLASHQRSQLIALKKRAFEDIAAFVATSVGQYGVTVGGDKGNVTLTSYDGRFRVVRHMHDRIVFGEQLMAAKALIDECVKSWSNGANDNLLALVAHAFQTDKEGKINTTRVLSLRRLKIGDSAWGVAMDAISDSMSVASTATYLRFYERPTADAPWQPITLDVAGVDGGRA